MLLTRSLTWDSKINKSSLKRILSELRVLVDELEVEVLADPDNYKLNVDYQDVVDYYNNPDNAEEGL